MGGAFLASGSGRAHRHILSHLRTRFSGEPLKNSSYAPSAPLNHLLPQRHQQRARVFVGSRRVASKFKESSPSSQLSSPRASSVLSSSAKVAAAAAAVSSFSSAKGIGFVNWYLRMIETRPILTKSLTACAIFTAADVSSQKITLESSDLFDMARTLRMTSYGLIVSGPSLHLWFNFVSRVLPKRDVLTTCKKMFLGQVIFGPIMTAIFFSFNARLQGETGTEIFARLKRDLIPTLKTGLMYWPLCDFITFKFFPVRLQPLVSNSFSFLWTIYITYMASLKKADTEEIAVTGLTPNVQSLT